MRSSEYYLQLTETSQREEAVSMPKANRGRPALSPEARENQLISLAVDLAERQMLEGTASSQVITHFLKLGTTRAELEKEKLKRENKVLEAKAKAIESSEEVKVLYENALKAMRNYAGYGEVDEYED